MEDLLQQLPGSKVQVQDSDITVLVEKVNKLHVDLLESHTFRLEDTLPSRLIFPNERYDWYDESLRTTNTFFKYFNVPNVALK
jgi:hypothetical protein